MDLPYRNTRPLTFLYLLSFFGDLGYSVFLVASIFLAYQMGANPALVGGVGSAYGICYVISPTIAGKIGDKITRRTSLLIATTGQVIIALFLIFLVRTPYDLIIGQALMGIFYGFYWPAVEAKISEETNYSSQAHTTGMAIYSMVFSVGLGLGPFLSGILADWNIRVAFILDLSIYLSGFLVVLFGLSQKSLKNQPIPHIRNKNSTKISFIEENSRFLGKNHVIVLVLGAFLFSTLSNLLLVYFPDYALIPESLAWSGTLIGTVILCFGLGRTVYFAVGFHDKMTLRSLILTILIGGISIILIPFIINPWILGILFIIIGIIAGRIFLLSLNLLLIQRKNGKGAAAGIFESGTGLGAVLIPISAGLLAEISLNLPFIVLGGLMITLFLLSWFLIEHKR